MSLRVPFESVLISVTLTVGLSGCPDSPAPSDAPDQQPAKSADIENQSGGTAMTMSISSPAFKNDARIPVQFTGDGEDRSPQLTWTGVPADAKELALICDDPDAPTAEPWVHWVIYKIPASLTGLPERVTPSFQFEPASVLQGPNSWGEIGYRGPMPPAGHGVHHYHFKLYALDAPVNADPVLGKNGLLRAMQGHILSQAELVGTYER